MIFHALTLFPQLFDSFCQYSLFGKALREQKIFLHLHNLRDFGVGKTKKIDDKPYGVGDGMLLKPEPIYDGLEHIKKNHQDSYKILLDPKGEVFSDKKAELLSKKKAITFVCGRYQGFDKRVSYFVDEQISIGDYILFGGELAAMILMESISRKIEGVLGNVNSLKKESHQDGFLEVEKYTRPSDFLGWKVPEVLLSGDHGKIQDWCETKRKKKFNFIK
jgi:tRNA (guanine37-N1)-methyltransferase